MTDVYPSAHRIKANLAGTWTDLTGYVIEDITGSWGIQGNGPLDLLADAGIMRFTLNNMDQRFTPGHGSALAGWMKGIQIKLEIVFEGETWIHLGTIKDISVPLADDFFDRALVTVGDWLESGAQTPIVNPGVLSNQRGDQVINTVISLVPVAPAATDLDEGKSTFPTTFDTVTSYTKAYSELAKVAYSEPGHVYLRKDRVYGETLVFENSLSRHGWRSLSPLALSASQSGYLLKEDGGKLLKEDGGGILLNQTTTFTADNTMIDIESDYGRQGQVVNYFTVYANPRRLDTSAQILFRLDAPIPIASGQTVTIKGSYADPAGGFPVNGQDMITPVATTDYLLNSLDDGGGLDLTADLVLVSTPFGSEGFTHQVYNGSANSGWIIQYDLRGYGIYQYNPIEHVASDPASILQNGHQTETLDQKYQSQLDRGRVYVNAVVEDEKDPRVIINKVTFLANHSQANMLAFLTFGPGDLIRIKSTRRNVDSYFYIQGVSEYRITPGGMIMFTWVVKQVLTMALGLSMIAVEIDGGTDAVNFGVVPSVLNLDRMTYSAWVYRSSDGGTIMGAYDDSNGFQIYGALQLAIASKKFTNFGSWLTVDNVFAFETWTHVVVTFDASVGASADPVVYIDGVQEAITEGSTPGGSRKSEDGTPFIVGNNKTATQDYNTPWEGKFADVRVYDRILSAAEVTTLYNSGTPDKSLVTDGLVFQAFAVPTSKLSSYIDATLTSSMKLRDAISGALGTPIGSPVGRTAP